MSSYRAPRTPPAGLPSTNTRNYTPNTLRGDTLRAGESGPYRQKPAVRDGERSYRVVPVRAGGPALPNAAGVTVCDLGDTYQG
jgi:hypothetical protein